MKDKISVSWINGFDAKNRPVHRTLNLQPESFIRLRVRLNEIRLSDPESNPYPEPIPESSPEEHGFTWETFKFWR